MVKKILFICKHNIFRSRVAEIWFNRTNKDRNYRASSAGIIPWNKKNTIGDIGYVAEKKAAKKFGIDLSIKSQPVTASLLNKTDILVVVADDVPAKIFRTDDSFNGKVLAWKVPDVKDEDRDKEKIAEKTIRFIQKKVEGLVKTLN